METTEKRTLEQISRCAGNSLLAMLHHPKTVEIMLNPDGSMWVEQLGSKCQCFGEMNPSIAQALMQNIAGSTVRCSPPSVAPCHRSAV